MHFQKVLFLAALSLVSVLALTTSESNGKSGDMQAYNVIETKDIKNILVDENDIYLELSEDDETFEGDVEEVTVYATDIHKDQSSAWRRALLAKDEEDCRKPKKTSKQETCRQPKKPSPPPPKKPSPPPPKRPPPPPQRDEEEVYNPPYFVPEPQTSPPPEPVINAPPPPPREDMCTKYTPRRKILSGPRVVPDGGLRACTGLHVSSPNACCQICQQTSGCAGWMYTKPLDCRQFGFVDPQNVCYMVSEVTGSYDPILGGIEYSSATATY